MFILPTKLNLRRILLYDKFQRVFCMNTNHGFKKTIDEILETTISYQIYSLFLAVLIPELYFIIKLKHILLYYFMCYGIAYCNTLVIIEQSKTIVSNDGKNPVKMILIKSIIT